MSDATEKIDQTFRSLSLIDVFYHLEVEGISSIVGIREDTGDRKQRKCLQ